MSTDHAADVPSLPESNSEEDRLVNQTLNRIPVEFQWEYLRLVEQLDEAQATRLLSGRLEAYRRAADSLAPLEYWPRLPQRNYDVYLGNSNRVRARRVLDFINAGDRVLDVGCGFGYLAGILLRNAPIASYCGLDIEPHLLDGARQMAEVNRLDPQRLDLHRKSLFDLDREFVAAQRPTLLLCLEVLEHLENPDAALAAIARSLTADHALLFSVPMLGRLETCWGHYSLFSSERLSRMCEAAGLNVHHVEPVYATWVFILASPAHSLSRTIPGLPALPPAGPPPIDLVFRTFDLTRLEAAVSRWNYRARTTISRGERGEIRCHVAGGTDTHGGQYGGVALAIDAPHALRLDLELENPVAAEQIFIDGYTAGGERSLRWQCEIRADAAPDPSRKTIVFKPGRAAGSFRSVGRAAPDEVATIEIFAKLRAGQQFSFTIHKIASYQLA